MLACVAAVAAAALGAEMIDGSGQLFFPPASQHNSAAGRSSSGPIVLQSPGNALEAQSSCHCNPLENVLRQPPSTFTKAIDTCPPSSATASTLCLSSMPSIRRRRMQSSHPGLPQRYRSQSHEGENRVSGSALWRLARSRLRHNYEYH